MDPRRLSEGLEREIARRLAVGAEDATLSPDEKVDRVDVLREAVERSEDRESPYHVHRHELRRLQVHLGMVRPLDLAAARETARAGGASVAKQVAFRLEGVAYRWASWDPLERER